MVHEIIKKRRSIRKYDPQGVVTEEQIKEILEAGMLAPSARNLRPWKFIAVTNRGLMNEIMKVQPFSKMIESASCVIVVCGLPELHKGAWENGGMWQQDCGAAVENMLLQAASMDLGTCWCGLHPVERFTDGIRKLFGLDKDTAPFALIAVGVPAEDFGSRGFYEAEKVEWKK